jgi:cyclic beta-1,2-glucan synthetase
MEKRNGHIYNWYDTRTLAPIRPITISSVDSGNLAASFYTLRSGTEALLRCPLLEPRIFHGIRDHLQLLASLDAPPTGLMPPPLDDDLHAWVAWALQAEQSPAFAHLGMKTAPGAGAPPAQAAWWLLELRTRIRAFADLVRDYLPWLQPEFASLRQTSALQTIFREAETTPLESLAGLVADLDNRLQRAWTTSASDSPEVFLAEKLRTMLPAAQANFEALSRDLRALAAQAERSVAEMDFAFLIEPSRQILSIGYMVEQEELHKACYDLLCSEARIAAFIAVAKGEATQQSWFKLGRIHTVAYGRPALISWTGTMFEYLMPALWMRAYPDTLVTRTLDSVVHIQRAYASEHGNIPWGVSECGYAQKDDAGHYHYLAFGIPAIALKWDAIAGPVISPYSTFLALTIDQAASMRNLERMAKLGWIGAYGFYEAADYQESTHEPKLVREWMAHHQGMSLLAVLNLIHENITQDWFHANANLKATELLLHEKPIRQAVLMAEHKQSTTRRRKPAA